MRNTNDMIRFVSLVVPVYNGESTIKFCLDCIMNLRYPNEKREVIVVDDGSTDETLDIVAGYPVKLIKKDHNGYPSAMNAGIKVAKGEIVAIIDSDVYLDEDWLVRVVTEFKDPKVGIASGYGFGASPRGFWARLVGFEAQDRIDALRSKYLDFITSACTAYRNRLFAEVGLFNESLRRGSDEDLAHRAFKAGWKIVLRRDALFHHDWNFSFKKYFVKQILNTKYQVENFARHPELLRGKQQHPPTLYIPLILTFLLLLTPAWYLVDSLWVSVFSALGLIFYHLPQTVRIIRKHKEWSMVLFPIAINGRYVAWLIGLAIGVIGKVVHR